MSATEEGDTDKDYYPHAAAAAAAASTINPHSRKNRKSWTEEEKRAFWLEKKREKKQRRRESRAEKSAAEQQVWERLSEDEKEAKRQAAIAVHECRRRQEAELEERCRSQLANPHVPRLVFDLSFAWCMTAADTKSTVAQIKFSYSALRHAGFPMVPVITSLIGKELLRQGSDDEGDSHSPHNRLKEEDKVEGEHDVSVQQPILSALKHFEGFRKFPFPIHETAHWSAVFPKEQVVFLTADAEEVLKDFEPDTVYVVGAFVDHNQHKCLSYRRAQRHGVRTARLPIKEHIDVSNRCQILTINHVVDVVAHFMTSSERDWKRALEDVLPVRRVHQEILGSRKKRRREAQENESTNGSSDGGSKC